MANVNSGYDEFRRVANALRSRVKVTKVVASGRRFMMFGDNPDRVCLERAVSLGARANQAELTAEEFSQAVQELQHTTATA